MSPRAPGGRWDELRLALAEEPGELAFRAACALLDTWPGPDADEAFAAAGQHLDAWPDRVRVAPRAWLCALRAGAATSSWRFVRTARNFSDHPGTEPVPLRSVGERPEWAVVKRVELDGRTDDDLRWLLETQTAWPQLHSLKASFRECDAATARALASSPLLPRLRTLSLDAHGRDFPLDSLAAAPRLGRLGLHARFEDVRRLLERSRLTNLYTLKVVQRDFRGETSDPNAAARLGAAPGLERLRVLELESLDEDESKALLASPALDRLREVVLDGEPGVTSGPGLADALRDKPFLARLRRLTITRQALGDEGVMCLADTLRHTRVERLELVDVGLGDEGTFALSSCTGLRRLQILYLGDNRVGSLGAATLAGSPYLENLTELRLGGSAGVGDLGVISLAGKATFAGLRSLSLRDAGLTPRGAAALAASRSLRGLRELTLARNCLGAEGATRLAGAALLPGLGALDLSHCGLDDGAADALARADLSRLRSLGLGHNAVGWAGARALAESPALRGLWRLDVRDNPLGAEGHAALSRLSERPALVERLL